MQKKEWVWFHISDLIWELYGSPNHPITEDEWKEWGESFVEALASGNSTLNSFAEKLLQQTSPPSTRKRESGSPHPSSEAVKEAKIQFEAAREAYPGQKRGLETEWEHFIGKYGIRVNEYSTLLLEAVKAGKRHREWLDKNRVFCPNWRNFRTWINQKGWEDIFPTEVYR